MGVRTHATWLRPGALHDAAAPKSCHPTPCTPVHPSTHSPIGPHGLAPVPVPPPPASPPPRPPPFTYAGEHRLSGHVRRNWNTHVPLLQRLLVAQTQRQVGTGVGWGAGGGRSRDEQGQARTGWCWWWAGVMCCVSQRTPLCGYWCQAVQLYRWYGCASPYRTGAAPAGGGCLCCQPRLAGGVVVVVSEQARCARCSEAHAHGQVKA